MACHPRATCHIAGCYHLVNSMSWYQSYVSHWRVLLPGEFNGMSSLSHVSHRRVLPLGEFTVMIPEPHAILQGVIIPSAILKIVFCHKNYFIFFCFLMQFGLWRAAAFVSSPITILYVRGQSFRPSRRIAKRGLTVVEIHVSPLQSGDVPKWRNILLTPPYKIIAIFNQYLALGPYFLWHANRI